MTFGQGLPSCIATSIARLKITVNDTFLVRVLAWQTGTNNPAAVERQPC
jgi:hypothetical protein